MEKYKMVSKSMNKYKKHKKVWKSKKKYEKV